MKLCLRHIVAARHDALMSSMCTASARPSDVAEDFVDASMVIAARMTDGTKLLNALQFTLTAGHRAGDMVEDLLRNIERCIVDLGCGSRS